MTAKKPEHLKKRQGSQNGISNNPIGRPSGYRPEYCQMIIDYFVKGYEELYFMNRNEKGDMRAVPGKFPTFERFGFTIGKLVKVMLDWCRQYPEFAEAYQQCKQLQKACLVEGAMAGALNSNFANLFARVDHGMQDAQQVVVSGDPAKPFIVNTFLPPTIKTIEKSDNAKVIDAVIVEGE